MEFCNSEMYYEKAMQKRYILQTENYLLAEDSKNFSDVTKYDDKIIMYNVHHRIFSMFQCIVMVGGLNERLNNAINRSFCS